MIMRQVWEARLLSGEVDVALGNSSHLEEESIDLTPYSDPVMAKLQR